MKFQESETVELKKSTSELKEAIISMVAILNKHRKGKIYFGITDEGEIIGQNVSGKIIRNITQTISENVEPKVYPKVEEIELEGKKCICVEFSGINIPYFAYRRSYMRVGDEGRPLSARELEEMVLRKNQEKLKWDTEICENATFDDINSEKLQWFLKEANLDFDSIKGSLEKLGLAKGDRLLNAAVILFGKHPEKFFPNAKLRCAVFGAEDIIDMHDYEGDLFYLIEKAEEYILANIHIGMRLKGMKRIDVPEIDNEAFREAIINAFSHRDYNQYDSVNIAVFKDRVEIRNPGLLYGGLTIEEIRKEKVSKRRNELIAAMFHKVHFVERWGRGIGKILMKEPKTIFQEIAGQFWTVFKRKAEILEKVTGTSLKPPEGFGARSEEVRRKFGESSEKIFDEIVKNPFIKAEEIAQKIGITRRAVEKNIARLREAGLLQRIGPDKGGHWKVIEE